LIATSLNFCVVTNVVVVLLQPPSSPIRLEEFKMLNPPVDLIKGAEMEMTIRGDTMLYKNAVGGVGTIRSEIFTRALCDVYYGEEAVSPTHKAAVLEGIPKL
jgi:hypothetical protein